jgi:hypothetical protein
LDDGIGLQHTNMTTNNPPPPPPSHLRVASSQGALVPNSAQEEADFQNASNLTSPPYTASLWEVLYGTLFNPVVTFNGILQLDPLPLRFVALGAGVTLGLSVLCALAKWAHPTGNSAGLAGLGVQLPLVMAIGLSGWIVSALLMATISYVFTGVTRFQQFLVLSALSSLPWVLIAPLMLLQTGSGTIGAMVAGLTYFALWLWTTTLYTMAVSMVYKMTAVQVMLFFALPLLAIGLLLAMLIPVMIASVLGWFV